MLILPAGGNNGSALCGLQRKHRIFECHHLAWSCCLPDFLPIIGTLAIAGSLARKEKIAATAGTLSTTNAMFVFLLIFIVLLVGALSFFPALALGPIAEFFDSIV
ncbi:MAG: potassium-transporting ATPase subunit KdpA [Oscillospiraceae bacterium]